MKKKEKGAISFGIDVSIYNTYVIVVIGQSKYINKCLSKRGLKKIDISNVKGAAGYTFQLEEGILLWLKQKPPFTAFNMGCLVHEIFHCTEFILSRVGLKLSKKSDEAYAYLMGYITENIFNTINNLNNEL